MKVKLYRIRRCDGKRIYCANPAQLERKYFEGFNPVYQYHTTKGWIMWTGKDSKSKY
jgi:hypothetical protein